MNKHNLRSISIIIVVTVVLGATATFANGYYKIKHHGRIPENTYLGPVDVSMLTPPEVKELLTPKIEETLNKKITISVKDRRFETSLSNLGFTFDLDKSVKNLTVIDAKENSSLDILILSTGDKNENLIFALDKQKLRETLESGLLISEIIPQNATFAFEGQKLVILPEKEGEMIKDEALLEALESNLKNLAPTDHQITLEQAAPTIKAADLEPFKETFSAAVLRKITIKDPVYAEDWTLRLIDNPEYVAFTSNDVSLTPFSEEATKSEEFPVQITINPNAFQTFIDEELAKWLDREPEPLKAFYDENKKIKIEGKGIDGRRILRDQLIQDLNKVILSETPEVTVPIEVIKAPLEIDQELQNIGIKEIISVGHTSYYGSPANRVHNIKVGAEKFAGILVLPGEEFSFNTLLGPVDGSTGYLKEKVIKAEGTIPEYGGGICQVSTTVYRAALLAGLEITARREHSYAVSYYSQILGHGLDATIYLGGQDFRFKNNTPAPILIHTYVENDYELYFVFLGTSDGRSVELEGPNVYGHSSPGGPVYIESATLAPGETKQVEKAHTGFSADWKRHITDKDGNVVTEDIRTRYRAIPAKFLRGPGEAAPETP